MDSDLAHCVTLADVGYPQMILTASVASYIFNILFPHLGSNWCILYYGDEANTRLPCNNHICIIAQIQRLNW